uniref:proteinase-activated receptor 3-like n=1 Tax=Gasterosteus aculeatus aculeatus TaxID=481459 RepID=UPI001A98A7C9|nr:proteinase-activated receptor 3-like [Gasterosteus aculeatus aculeatus]
MLALSLFPLISRLTDTVRLFFQSDRSGFFPLMEVLHINSSLLLVSHRTVNYTVSELTEYQKCKDMTAAIIWYLGMQFVNMFLGIPANIMVLWLIRSKKGDSSTSDIFIFHLAILDMFFCLTPPLEVANIVFLTTSSTWYVLRFFYGIKDTSPLFLCCICLDRYMAVVHPITFTELKGRRHRTVMAAVVWLIILAYAGAKSADDIPNFEAVFTATILAAFAFMVFCNISILLALRQSGPGRDEMHPVKKRAFKMVLIILAIIVFNYFPLVALMPFKSYFQPGVSLCYVHYVVFGLMDFSSSIQPMLYLSKEKLHCCQSGATQLE